MFAADAAAGARDDDDASLTDAAHGFVPYRRAIRRNDAAGDERERRVRPAAERRGPATPPQPRRAPRPCPSPHLAGPRRSPGRRRSRAAAVLEAADPSRLL